MRRLTRWAQVQISGRHLNSLTKMSATKLVLDFFYILSNLRHLILFTSLTKMSNCLDCYYYEIRPIFSDLIGIWQKLRQACSSHCNFDSRIGRRQCCLQKLCSSSSTLWIAVTSLVWSDPKITKYGPQHSTLNHQRGWLLFSKKLLKYLNTPIVKDDIFTQPFNAEWP